MKKRESRGILAEFLSVRDVQRLRNALCYIGTSEFPRHLRRLLRARMRFDTFLVMRFEPAASPILQSSWFSAGFDGTSALQDYRDRTYLFDPFHQHESVPAGGALYQISQIAPDRFFSSEYYLEYYRTTGLCDEIGMLCPLAGGARAHVSISRLETNGPFRRREVACLRHHAPVLLEMLSQHATALQALDEPAARTLQFDPLSDIIRGQTRDMFGVPLTRREAEIAALVLMGHSNRSAALRLGIARETCKVHRRNLYSKLSISSQGQLFSLLKHLL